MRILVVDDDAVSRQALADLARSAGGRAPVEAADGRAAWARLDAGETVGLVLSDIRMPHLNGFELVARLRGDRRFEHLPVMLVSTANDRATVENAAQAGVQGYLLKPVTQGAVQRVRQVLARFRESLVERDAQALVRLGLDESRLDECIAALASQGLALADKLAAALKAEQDALFRELLSTVQTQRAVALRLGARRLGPVLGWIERCLKGFTVAERAELAQALASFRLHLYWLQHAGKLFPG
ncbi:MAG TPA: response regulator [Albitalea sp.]|nr:response regulator [Albitalea sp.]